MAMNLLGNGLTSGDRHEESLSVCEAHLSILRRLGTEEHVMGRFVEHGPVEHFCTSITAMPAYEGQSFEELRLEDLIRETDS